MTCRPGRKAARGLALNIQKGWTVITSCGCEVLTNELSESPRLIKEFRQFKFFLDKCYSNCIITKDKKIIIDN